MRAVANSYTKAPYIGAMNRNALTNVLWRTLGGVFGVALLIGAAFALHSFVSVTGINLA